MMLQQLNIVGDSCESTLVLKRKADILSISYGISIYQLHSNILVDACNRPIWLLSIVELWSEIRLCSVWRSIFTNVYHTNMTS